VSTHSIGKSLYTSITCYAHTFTDRLLSFKLEPSHFPMKQPTLHFLLMSTTAHQSTLHRSHRSSSSLLIPHSTCSEFVRSSQNGTWISSILAENLGKIHTRISGSNTPGCQIGSKICPKVHFRPSGHFSSLSFCTAMSIFSRQALGYPTFTSMLNA
jgi:hypothetical protein